MIKLTATS